MNKDEIQYIFDKHYRKINTYINKVAHNFDPEDIHEFRICYKKLRAFFRMLSNGDLSYEIKIHKKLKRCYTVAGSIRDLQLQIQRLKESAKGENKKLNSYLNSLENEITRLVQELASQLKEKPAVKSKQHSRASLPAKYPPGQFNEFVQKKWNEIFTIICDGSFSDDKLHSIRKVMKDLIYNSTESWLPKDELIPADIWKGKSVKYFNGILDKLGTFQDKCTAIALLRSYWTVYLDIDNIVILERIKQQWQQEKQSMKKKLIKQLTADLC